MINFLRHLFLPHHTNNHRPKILHHENIFTVVIFLIGLSLITPHIQKSYPAVLGVSANIPVQELLSLTNQKRAENGLAPLNLDPQLSAAAEGKLADMFAQNYWAHIAPNGTTPWYFIKNSGYEYVYAGENLARGYDSASAVVNAWMDSPTHRDNLLSSNYSDIGFAVASGSLTGSETVLVVQQFGRRYVAQNRPQVPIAAAIPTPTPIITQTISNQTPTPIVTQVVPTASPTQSTPSPTTIQEEPDIAVAASQNQPLINGKSTTRNFSIFLLILFIAVLILDIIIIERKKIKRIAGHNLDHIIFFAILLITAIIIGGGAIL